MNASDHCKIGRKELLTLPIRPGLKVTIANDRFDVPSHKVRVKDSYATSRPPQVWNSRRVLWGFVRLGVGIGLLAYLAESRGTDFCAHTCSTNW